MLQKKSNPVARLKYVYVLPLTAVFLIAFAYLEVSGTTSKTFIAELTSPQVHNSDTISKPTMFDDDNYEEIPQFPGGERALLDFIKNNLQYPEDAQENGKQGRVITSFTIEIDGSISDIAVIRGIYPSLDKEAIRLISTMPKWIPGSFKHEIVKMRYTLPIMFRLQ